MLFQVACLDSDPVVAGQVSDSRCSADHKQADCSDNQKQEVHVPVAWMEIHCLDCSDCPFRDEDVADEDEAALVFDVIVDEELAGRILRSDRHWKWLEQK